MDKKIIGFMMMAAGLISALFFIWFALSNIIFAKIISTLAIISLTSILFWVGLVIFLHPGKAKSKLKDR